MVSRSTPSSRPLRVLVVDDEPRIRNALRVCLEGEGYAVTETSGAEDTLAEVQSRPYDLALLDLRLPGASGMDLLPDLLEEQPHLQVLVITAHSSIDSAVEAMRRGATDYLPKPFTPAQVRQATQKAAERRTLERKVAILEEEQRQRTPASPFDTESPAMQDVVDTARDVANRDVTVLLRGENGTGKSVLARAIHRWSDRSEAPFVTVHGPSLSKDLLESELFGHKKGAFTGATETNPGRVSQAEGGTLFLDELGALPLDLQPKLLRFIEEKEYERVGDPVTREADVRLLAATNQDLEAAVEAGTFRQDLLYRLNVIELTLPSLRDRPEDIVPLARQFVASFGEKYDRPVDGLSADAERRLPRHDWPGNVRELRNAIERAVILTKQPEIDAEHLPLTVDGEDEGGDTEVGQFVSLASIEEAHLRRVIEATDTLDEAAEVLGIDPATLYRKRKKYGLSD
ncbi:MAG: sigma-54-dependent Fis family transcriptional regulator [Bacteroidetes bacterium QS_7_67_15]|nr:MAG: sigma-54-dependent Fis family transcriptional regulator [Bacteroidetes bacterium QS_7_67_15]